jgi:glycolate oxidase FAD binding subunit
LFEKDDALILKVSLLPDEICSASAELLQQWRSGSTEISIVAQATGLMVISVTSTPEIALALVNQLRERLESSGGSVVVLRAPEPLHEKMDVWGPDRGTFPLMREIKRRFDPNRILNPGRFVGNI